MHPAPEPSGSDPISTRSLVLWILLPIVPLAAGFLVLGLIDHAEHGIGGKLPGLDDFYTADRDLRFFNAYLPFAALSIFHVAGCLAVAAYLGLRIRAMAEGPRRAALTILGGIVAALVVLSFAVRTDQNRGALNLGYRYICGMLKEAGVATHILPTTCTAEGLSLFAWSALLPYISGMLAAAVAAAAAATAYRPVTATDPAEVEGDLNARAGLVETCFQATAFVLVTSTLALVLFYRLPLSVIDAEKETAVALMTGYAQGMTLFWGVLFSLTLAAIFGPGTVLLRRQLHRARPGIEALDLPEALRPATARQRIIGTLTTLAPLLIGASGSVLEQIAGAL